jgi:isopentenyldiphosphate isomerase
MGISQRSATDSTEEQVYHTLYASFDFDAEGKILFNKRMAI